MARTGTEKQHVQISGVTYDGPERIWYMEGYRWENKKMVRICE